MGVQCQSLLFSEDLWILLWREVAFATVTRSRLFSPLEISSLEMCHRSERLLQYSPCSLVFVPRILKNKVPEVDWPAIAVKVN